MENGVKILIERMKTNPEEFVPRGNKWMGLIMQYSEYLSEHNKELLHNALRPILMKQFNEDVLKTLIHYDEVDPQGDLFAVVSDPLVRKPVRKFGNSFKP